MYQLPLWVYDFSYKAGQLTKDNLGKSYEASNVTLLSSRGTLQEVMHILLWMLVKQLENLQYNVLRIVNVSDHILESKHSKCKNDI